VSVAVAFLLKPNPAKIKESIDADEDNRSHLKKASETR
jgi:hypothetical protein